MPFALGGFIDHNKNETMDTRTQEELLAVWDAARLTGTAADESGKHAGMFLLEAEPGAVPGMKLR
ncbi:MAG: hypothetical protein EBX59_10085 [Betaproteobacteria bacterium]|nr:hypothetical protein [Betaproteobacteria bacterium]